MPEEVEVSCSLTSHFLFKYTEPVFTGTTMKVVESVGGRGGSGFDVEMNLPTPTSSGKPALFYNIQLMFFQCHSSHSLYGTKHVSNPKNFIISVGDYTISKDVKYVGPYLGEICIKATRTLTFD